MHFSRRLGERVSVLAHNSSMGIETILIVFGVVIVLAIVVAAARRRR
jgi:hypothetical protein